MFKDWSASLFFKTQNCGACEETLCTSQGISSSFEFIDAVVLEELNITTGNNRGYFDGRPAPATTRLIRGQEYDYTIGIVFPIAPEPVALGIWLDGNQNGTLEDSEMLDTVSMIEDSYTGSIVVPMQANLGYASLRTIMKAGATPEPCGGYTYGETEDYCVEIVDEMGACTFIETGYHFHR